jgi:hypothetical protein
MDKHNLSWCNWSVGDKNESASIIVPGAPYFGKWKSDQLSQSGRIIRRKCRQYAGIIDKEGEKSLQKVRKRLFFVKPL